LQIKPVKKENIEEQPLINKKNTIISPQMYNNFMNFNLNFSMNHNFANFPENFNQNLHVLNAFNERNSMNYTNNTHQNPYCMNNLMFFANNKDTRNEDLYANSFEKSQSFQKQPLYYKF